MLKLDRPTRALRLLLLLAVAFTPLLAQDTTPPATVGGLEIATSIGDLQLSWDPVSLDANGAAEIVTQYRIYRGVGPEFPLQFKPIGTSLTPDLFDPGAAAAGPDYYYLITAIDDSGNESAVRPGSLTDPPQLSGFWTGTTIELQWDPAEPQANVDFYRVYIGESPREYNAFVDIGTLTSFGFTGLEFNKNYFFAVVAFDLDGIPSALSNEHVDALAGTIDLSVHQTDQLCFGGACPHGGNGFQRRGGQELMIPVSFPAGDWTNITMTYTIASNLCSNVPDKCGDQNPGWNPCGDPWDRTASVFLVLNDCVSSGNCYGSQGNLELIRTITPFGTDALPPDGTGAVPPASWTMDITPYRSLLTGDKYVGAFIATWVNPGWEVSVDFHFSEDPLEASPKPPAAGVIPVWFRDGGNSTATTQVSIPVEATSVVGRLFTTGHGGILDETCACSAQGRPCDEFCSKLVNIQVDGGIRWAANPFRTDCSPLGEGICGPGSCQDWNACGCSSCTFNRSGWCPGLIACHENEPCDQDLPADSWFAPGTSHEVNMDVRLMTPGASWANSLAIYWYE